MRVLVTGASGFVGSALCDHLSKQGCTVMGTGRRQRSSADVWEFIKTSAIDGLTDWSGVGLSKVDVIVHSAARVHVMDEVSTDPLAEFRLVNVQGTLNLARQAAEAGVRRFVFISSIKVNGESTQSNQPFSADDIPAPADPYGVSKAEAEVALLALSKSCEMEVVIIRPVLVYGPQVRANFYRLMSWLYRGFPLPLGAVSNKRSFVALDNLVDLITVSLSHPAAAGQIFLVSDDEDLSTTQLLRRLSTALGSRALLLPVPPIFLRLIASMFGKRAEAERLCGSLQVDIGKTKKTLGWCPPVTVDKALRKTVAWYLDTTRA